MLEDEYMNACMGIVAKWRLLMLRLVQASKIAKDLARGGPTKIPR